MRHLDQLWSNFQISENAVADDVENISYRQSAIIVDKTVYFALETISHMYPYIFRINRNIYDSSSSIMLLL